MNSTQSDRDHAFDALRASMMLLGIVLHAACNYITVSALDVWPYQDPNTSVVADLVVVGIHTFRMPIFFVMAGFFTALLLERRGAGGMMKNRLVRVVAPFALFWVIVQPAVVAAAIFANGVKSNGRGLDQIANTLATSPYWSDNTAHLWFLWYLAIFCVVTALGATVARFLPHRVRTVAALAFRSLMGSRVRPLLLAVPMVGVLMLQGGMLQTALSFAPDPRVLVGYYLFFAFGLALRYHRDLLPTLTRDARLQLALGVLLVPLNVSAALKLGPTATAAIRWQASITGGIMVWLLIFGITGLAMRWARHERPWVRYLTDASYWMYLVHLPFMLWLPGLMAQWNAPAPLKIMVTIFGALPILLVSYHWLVRGTALGALLSGRRYEVGSLIPGPTRSVVSSPSVS